MRALDRFQRIRYASALAIQLLIVVAIWPDRRRLAIQLALYVAAISANVLVYRRARRSGRPERFEAVKLALNGLIFAVNGHLCAWPLPLWLYVPFNAFPLGERSRRVGPAMALFIAFVSAVALLDGVAPLMVASFALITAIIFLAAEARSKMIAHRTDELHAAHVALAEAQAIAKIGTYTYDPSTGEVTWSEQLKRIFGVDEALSYETFFARVHDDDRQAVIDAVTNAPSDGHAHEFRILRPDGAMRWIYGRNQLVGGRISGTVQDVTEKKQIDARLVLTDRLASLGTLASGMAHEINNPLAYVIANLEYIREELRVIAADEGIQRLADLDDVLGDACEGADRVRRVVRDLRSFARDERGAVDGHPSADVNDALGFAVKMATNEIRHRARLVVDVPPLPRVAASKSRLGQVLLNLLVNAAQSITEGNVDGNRIRVAAAVEGDRVVVEVSDSGCGMSPQVQASIFDPFFTTKPVGSGMGLGLSICHGIVTSFGGEICVRSEVGKGSTFRVAIPLATSTLYDVNEAATRVWALRKGRILIVDDDVLVATALRRMLPEHDVEIVHSGHEAVARAGERSFDVVLCDLLMPDLTGMDVYERLCASAPEVAARIVFMTGGAFTDRARRFLQQVPNRVFEKPVDRRTLRSLVGDMVAAPLAA